MGNACAGCKPLDYLKFAVTYRCNLDCRFCLQQEEGKTDLKWENFRRIIDDPKIIDSLRLVIFTGGEPLLWPYLDDAIRLSKQRGVKEIGLFTNGVLLDEERVRELRELNVDWVRTSLCGSTPEVNDQFLRKGKSYERIINALENLKKYGYRRKVRVTIMKPNLNDLEALVTKMSGMGIEELDFRVFSPTSIPKIDRDYQLSKTELRQLMPLLLGYQEKYKGAMAIKFLPGCYDFLYRDELPKVSEISHCSCGRTYLGVTAEGNMRVCFGMHDNIGNVARDDLAKVWAKSDMLNKAREFTGADECKPCMFLDYCKPSDCFAATYNQFGDFNHKNPLCPLDKPLTNEKEWRAWQNELC